MFWDWVFIGEDFHFCHVGMTGKSSPRFPKLPMSFAKPSSDELDRIATEVLAHLRRSDAVPSGLGKSFAEMEQAARAVAQRVATKLTAEMLTELAENAPESAPCPKCQNMWKLTRHKRTILTPDGPVDYYEPAAHCIACRCDFFPTASAVRSQ
jgi:hypothetical protein